MLIIRQRNDDDFTALLERLRTNNLTLQDCHVLIKRIPILPIDTVQWPNDVVPLHLFGRVDDVDKVNRIEYAKLPGPECVSMSGVVWKKSGKDFVRPSNEFKMVKFEKDFLSNINVLSELKIKLNMQVIVRLNVYSANIYNGMRGRISRIQYSVSGHPALLELTLADGSTRELNKHTYTSEYDREHTLHVSQFPVSMAWATTIHKAQGMTLDKFVLDLSPRSIWSAYQAYVGLSRAKTLADVFLVNFVPATVTGCKEVEALYATDKGCKDKKEESITTTTSGKRSKEEEVGGKRPRRLVNSISSVYDYDSLYDPCIELVEPQFHGNVATSYLKDIDQSARHLQIQLRNPDIRTGFLTYDKSLMVIDKYDLAGYKDLYETTNLYPTGAYPLVAKSDEEYCPLVHTILLLFGDFEQTMTITFKRRTGVNGGNLLVEITKPQSVFLSGLFLKNYDTLLVDTKCTMKTFIK